MTKPALIITPCRSVSHFRPPLSAGTNPPLGYNSLMAIEALIRNLRLDPGVYAQRDRLASSACPAGPTRTPARRAGPCACGCAALARHRYALQPSGRLLEFRTPGRKRRRCHPNRQWQNPLLQLTRRPRPSIRPNPPGRFTSSQPKPSPKTNLPSSTTSKPPSSPLLTPHSALLIPHSSLRTPR